ncbi:ankyrin-1-like [Penaeus monodon]|uniref:ankyrin-1-like n=1 Tax=Penaeus monodon TaxID=6687 RepID=UPI0018A715D9|nr:ankyrin-1-like [Penaeus monodon]
MTPLHLASWGGHAEVIEVLLQKGANGNARTDEGMTAIHLASMGGHVSSMEALAPTCDILSVTRDGKSALHLAAEYGNLGAVQWLHLHGLATSLKDHSGQTPLQYAKDEGHKKVMDFLKRLDQQTLNRRRVKQRSPEALAQGAGSRDEEAARKPLDHRANPERPGDLEGGKGSPDLHTAASVGHVNVMRDLLKAGAPKDTMDGIGKLSNILHYDIKARIQFKGLWSCKKMSERSPVLMHVRQDEGCTNNKSANTATLSDVMSLRCSPLSERS